MSGAEPAGSGKKKRRGFEARPGFHVVGHRLALDPSASALQALASHCGAARVAYNWAVRHVLASWSQRAAEETYGVPEAERVAWRSWSLPSLRKAFNEAKHNDPFLREWWAQNSKEAYNTGLANAAAAFDNYVKSRRGERKGARMGRPRFKPKRKTRPACKFTTGTIRLDDRRHIVLPRLGRIRLHEDVQPLVDAIAEGCRSNQGSKVHEQAVSSAQQASDVGRPLKGSAPIAEGGTRILSVTVRSERGRWFAVLQTEERHTIAPAGRPGTAVGIDLGVKALLVMADSAGEVREVANPKHYDQALTQLRKASRTVSRRRGPNRRTGQAPSRRWEKANAVPRSSSAETSRTGTLCCVLWESAWAEFVPFLSFDVEIRKVICSTNAIESVNARIRKAVLEFQWLSQHRSTTMVPSRPARRAADTQRQPSSGATWVRMLSSTWAL
nr:transposase [Streptomyces sp. RPA4-2]